ncbi:uncharacterized protein LOC124370954 [Homalodisca vitripennis]|uniref:uncharacterized protein LOC124370954 n=1 Tax=Homalodisca vitripennis TaxID=197043 RepID=UPI001EE9AF1A|nr:uncharacterized protein LOC124370954 [Homalodisca vitripennis]
MRLEYAAEGLTLETIMNTLKEMREEQKTNTADFNRSYEMLYSKVEENTVTLRDGMGKIEDYLREIEQLKSENVALKKHVVVLETRIEDLENYSRRNCVEIQGIPEEKEEQVSELVKKVGKALDVNITDSMIDACHRIGKKTSERNQARGIVVKFVRRTDKEELMKKRREKKRDFSTRHLGLTMDIPVYLNESLSPARRRLLAQARQLRKERGYKYIWLRNGNILLRKEEKAPVVEIRTQADLNGL